MTARSPVPVDSVCNQFSGGFAGSGAASCRYPYQKNCEIRLTIAAIFRDMHCWLPFFLGK